jgi:hypothetical protein
MNQHQIRIMNDPEPSSEELFIQKACHIHALGRQWSESAGSAGLEALLSPCDRPALRDLIDKARNRQLISVEGREAVGRLAETCVRRVVGLTDTDAPVTRSGALGSCRAGGGNWRAA